MNLTGATRANGVHTRRSREGRGVFTKLRRHTRMPNWQTAAIRIRARAVPVSLQRIGPVNCRSSVCKIVLQLVRLARAIDRANGMDQARGRFDRRRMEINEST